MELKQLEYFLHLAKTGSVSQSAQALNISQPSLSRTIAQLEQTLQIQLFDRERRPIQLTEAGQFLQQHLTQPLQDIHQALELTRNFYKNQQYERLTIGFVASVLFGLLPEIISQLRQDLQQTYPDLEIKLIEISSAQQMQALKSGEIDVGFGRFHHHDALVKQHFLRHERYVVAVAKSHHLAEQAINNPQFSVKLSSLVNETLILYHRNPNPLPNLQHSDPLLQLFEQKQLENKNQLRVRDLQIALGMVAACEGITLVPDSLKTVRQEQICYIPLRHDDITSSMYLNILKKPYHFALPLLIQAIYVVYARHGIQHTPIVLDEH